MQKIDLKIARQFILSNQFDFGKNPNTLDVIQDLGYIQIDTISVIRRAHHHVLWTRDPNYEFDEVQIFVKEKRHILKLVRIG